MIRKDNGEELKCPIDGGELDSQIVFRPGVGGKEYAKCRTCKRLMHF